MAQYCQSASKIDPPSASNFDPPKACINHAYTIRDKVSENALVMSQIANNSTEQAMLGDFSKAIDDAVMDSSDADQNQMMQVLSDTNRASAFARVVFDLLKAG